MEGMIVSANTVDTQSQGLILAWIAFPFSAWFRVVFLRVYLRVYLRGIYEKGEVHYENGIDKWIDKCGVFVGFFIKGHGKIREGVLYSSRRGLVCIHASGWEGVYIA